MVGGGGGGRAIVGGGGGGPGVAGFWGVVAPEELLEEEDEELKEKEMKIFDYKKYKTLKQIQMNWGRRENPVYLVSDIIVTGK